MQIQSKAVHVGDRKKTGAHIPVATPIYTAASYIYESVETLDKIFGHELHGPSYQRYENPTNSALEEVVASLEEGAGALATASGMVALQTAMMVAMLDRPRRILMARDLYGATINLVLKVLNPLGFDFQFVDVCDLAAVEQAMAQFQPGCLLMETVSNPMLRVGEIDRLAERCRAARAALIVDNTFSTPYLIRPLTLGANLVVHSATKYLAGHGDVMGGVIVADADHLEPVRAYSRIAGPVLGPFESYLTMRGIKTFPLRMERQCANANVLFQWLRQHPCVDRVYFTGDPEHPDAAAIARQFPAEATGAIISFEVKDAEKADIFRFMDAMRMVVRATSLGDVHTMCLYPLISSHRDLPPKQRERMGIRDNLVRLSVGIEHAGDIMADLDQALRA
jgi:cystathionine gamma-synthase/methionine-gamma-lyase